MSTIVNVPVDDAELLELNDKGPFTPISTEDCEGFRRHSLGFYSNFNDVNDDDSNYHIRKLVCINSPYVVALSCEQGEHKRSCSGIIVQSGETKKILTSSYIAFGGGRSNPRSLKVEVLFHNGVKADGKVSYVDEPYGIALIHADLKSQKALPLLSTELVPLNFEVMSIGRNDIFGLMASRGKTKTRKDDLVSNDLMSCSCTISESGIGGPVFDSSLGLIRGMNVYMQKKSSLFIPTTILKQYLEQLLEYGRVVRPWLGIKTKDIREIKLDVLEHIFQSFPSTDGIVVDEVISGSPAQMAGVCTDDVIISCNGIPVTSSVEFSDLLLRMGKSHAERRVKRIAQAIEVKIQRPSICETIDKSIKFEAFPSINSNWPDPPLDVSDNSCGILLSSQVENCAQNVKNRAQEIGSRLGGLNSSSNLKTRNGFSSMFHAIEQTRPSIYHRTTPLDPHPLYLDPRMKFTAQVAVIYRDAPMHHQFPTNMDCHNLLPHSNAGFATFDHAIPPPVLQQMHMAGNHPPPRLIRGFPNAAPIAPPLSHASTGFVQDHNPMHAFPFGQRQPNFGGPGMMPSGPELGVVNNRADAFQRLAEMESREPPMPIHPFAAGNPSRAMYGREMDMGFRYT